MGDFFYQTRKILERHIRIGSKLSLADMIRESEEAGGVGVLRGAPLTVHTDQHGGSQQCPALFTHAGFCQA